MKVQYASLITRDAYLTTDFGLSYATKLFGAEAVSNLPKISRGKRKGLTHGRLVWIKATTGGWHRDESGGRVIWPGFVEAYIEINGALLLHTVFPDFDKKVAAERDERVRTLRSRIADDQDFVADLDENTPISAKLTTRLARYWGELAELSTW